MIIARFKRKTNIAEYILYMWQIEDLIRAAKFDINHIDRVVIRKFDLPESSLNRIKKWYQDLILTMKKESITEKGHLSEIKRIINDLNKLHLETLTNPEEVKYHELYSQARNNINSFIKKSGDAFRSEIEACLTGLYGYIMLRLGNKEISEETREAMTTFSNLLAALSSKFKDKEKEC